MTRVKDPYYQHAQVGITKPGTLNLESPKNLKPQALNPKPPPLSDTLLCACPALHVVLPLPAWQSGFSGALELPEFRVWDVGFRI